MSRPYIGSSIDELEALFRAESGDRSTHEALLHELTHRSTKRAVQLRTRVDDALKNASQTRVPEPEFDFGDSGAGDKGTKQQKQSPKRAEPPRRDTSATQSTPPSATKRQWSKAHTEAFPEVSNRPTEIIRAWSAIEILSPPTFDRPQAFEVLAISGPKFS